MTTTTQHTETPPTATGKQGAPAAERPWLLVARREVVSKLNDKSFVVGTLITIALVVGILGWTIATEGDTETYRVAAAPDAVATARLLADQVPDVDDAVRVEVVEVESAEAGIVAVQEESADVLLRPGDNGWTLAGREEVSGDLEHAAETVVRSAALQANAEAAGTSVSALQEGGSLGTELVTGDAEQQEFAEFMGIALALLFYMAALMFGYTLAGSIAEEKANRIVELITTKIPVRQLLIGKIAGNTALAVTQTAVFVAIGLVGISFTEYAELLPVVAEGAGWFAVFFLVGFCFVSCWWAVAGALASRAEDLQTTAAPLSFLMMAVFFGSFLFEDTALTVASYVPPFSCVLMPMRILEGDAALWEPFVAIGLLLAAMAATVVLAERLYRRALLQTQGRVTIKQAWSAAD